ncbi:arginine--tRNA ligase [Candidatus Woesearchaeota archaeon]|nr:arginine--tRNA ligase [Candidatus Woesearchaeota archaeon]
MFREKIVSLLAKETQLGKDEVESLLEVPPDEKLGDFAFPCFALAKKLRKSPVDIAKELASKLNQPGVFSEVRAVGPYVNFFVNASLLAEQTFHDIFKKKDKYGQSKEKKETVMVEFFHANTHKGVHIGHIRNISIGASLCNLLESVGKKVIRVNYQGDIGPHVAKCIWGYLHLKEKAPAHNKGVWLGEIYAKASKIIEENKQHEEDMQALNKKIYARDPSVVDVWKRTRKWCLDDFNLFYKDFGVKFDRLYFESETEGPGKEVMLYLLKKKIAEESAGAVIMDLKMYGLGVYVGITQQGHGTYNAKDLGLALLKQKEFTFDQSIHVVGSEQELYFKQLFKTFEILKSPLAGKSHHVSYGLVMLPEGKMSSREGTMVLYNHLFAELIQLSEAEIVKRHRGLSAPEVKKRARMIVFAALKYSMISRENSSVLVFDWEKALDFEGDTGPYIQYAHARCASVLRKANKKITERVRYELLSTSYEKKVIAQLSRLEETVRHAALHYKPYLLAKYCLDLAQAFNEFYHNCPVISELTEVMNARLLLVHSVKQVLENGLRTLGIEAPDEM